MWAVAMGYLTAREYDGAVEWSERSIQRLPENRRAHLILASSLGHLGRTQEARAALAAWHDLMPVDTDAPDMIYHHKNEADRAHLLDGLRKAGWEG